MAAVGLHRHPLVAALATIAALAVSAPAHALEANVTVPQTPVPLPQTDVTLTAPGTDVHVGPGGATVNIDPQKAIGGVTGGGTGGGTQPGSTPAAGSPAAPSHQSDAPSAGGSPARSTPAGAVKASPRTGQGSTPGASGNAVDTAAPGASRAASGAPGSTKSAPGQATGKTALPGRAGPDPAQPSPVRQIIEKIPAELLAALLAVALLAAGMSLVWLRERGRVRAAQRQAEVDPLTGIPNRLAFEQRLAAEWRRARRYGRPLGLLLLDLDGLKTVNDRDGHEAGDSLIVSAATQISEHVRQSDLAARLAGDEFVVLCPETPRPGLGQLAAKLTERLQRCGVAASVGWAELGDKDVAPGDLLARADAAMYQEKGRRRGASAKPSPTARPGFATAG